MTPHSLALPAVIAGAVAIGCSPILVRLSEIGPMATGVHRLL
ncbi:MAG: EamA/RhaT family transporter, partial [Alphaproteobacteria bacterium]|nr:EamA/RhaT family transporter [Alphaproteobacteria bacterium]MBM3557920.1 EamA/RhaT family transporter [Alphaproteobacteria bacterium]